MAARVRRLVHEHISKRCNILNSAAFLPMFSFFIKASLINICTVISGPTLASVTRFFNAKNLLKQYGIVM